MRPRQPAAGQANVAKLALARAVPGGHEDLRQLEDAMRKDLGWNKHAGVGTSMVNYASALPGAKKFEASSITGHGPRVG